ncbi:thioredoxin fold domain-containing protein [Saccharicrinis sp. GN24d3]|uniref:thioredoxin fold domain-containing protein n=1 Tax=Saccharicrinis sp. GN24d3 TaxID=3458416 RepID=UPI004035CF1A
MKKTLTVVTALILSANLFAQGIEFEHGTFADALAKAKRENKMVFMDCYTTWCGPCKALANNVFPQKEVGDYFNANYINVKMDMEKGEGPDLLKRYGVKGFPTLLYLDATGNVLYKRVGGGSPADIIADAKLAADPTERMDYIKTKYDGGDRSKAIVTKYIGLLRKNYLQEELKAVGSEYINSLTKEDILDTDNFKAYCSVGGELGSDKFEYVKTNKKKFVHLSNEEQVNNFIMMSYYNGLRSAAEGDDITKLDEVVKAFKAEYPNPQYHATVDQMYDVFYLNNKEFDKWFQGKETALKALETNNEQYVQTVIRTAYQVATDPCFKWEEGAYEKAIEWLNKGISKNEKPLTEYFCLAMIYKNQGNKEQALKNAGLYKEAMIEQGKDIDQRSESFIKSVEAM